MPRNIVVAMTPMIPRVIAAFLAFGLRNACTPSATASTPVRAVDPEAKARNIRRRDTAATGSRSAVEETACGHSPSAHSTNPMISITKTVVTKA